MTQEALRMALEAMESVTIECNNFHHPKRDQNHHWAKCPPVVRWYKAIIAIKEALAQTQEAVACIVKGCINDKSQGRFVGDLCSPCHAFIATGKGNYSQAYRNTQRTWVGLEGEEIRNLWEEATKPDRSTMTMVTSFARAIESKLKEVNT